MMDGTPPQASGSNAPPPPPPAAPPPPVEPAPPSGGGTSDNRTIWIVLSYLGLLALIPLLVEKEDREVQWHAKHGLVLMVAEFVAMIALWIVIMAVGAISGGLGCILGLIWPVFMLAVLVLHVMCIIKGVNGERLLVPGLSEFADRF
ncbi:MAG TPA: hypothetical protein VLT32_05295 [Candidatus Sulfomarinibacteraceae bacterium]|nr:hypothetical protein [Candidatus Sulfomarinibacteraceae bacterium]